jgi:hypothetical protein
MPFFLHTRCDEATVSVFKRELDAAGVGSRRTCRVPVVGSG